MDFETGANSPQVKLIDNVGASYNSGTGSSVVDIQHAEMDNGTRDYAPAVSTQPSTVQGAQTTQ